MRTVKEWVAKHDDQQPPASVKDRILRKQEGKCALSGKEFRPGDVIEFDHRTPLWMNGENRESNLQAVLGSRHKEKTKTEATVKAKIDSVRQKHFGLKKKRPLPGGKGDKWKKRMDGSVVLR